MITHSYHLEQELMTSDNDDETGGAAALNERRCSSGENAAAVFVEGREGVDGGERDPSLDHVKYPTRGR